EAGNDACHTDYNLAFNKDRTMIAYVKTAFYYGGNFHPLNAGTFLTFTDLCQVRTCEKPTSTKPILPGEPLGGLPVRSTNGASYSILGRLGYSNFDASIDNGARKLTLVLTNPSWGIIHARYVELYIPGSLINGNLALLVNDTRLYPVPSKNDLKQCLSQQSNDFCTKIKVQIDKLEGWSRVSIVDDSAEPRSSARIEILGTTAIPEFSSSYPAVALTSVILISVILVG